MQTCFDELRAAYIIAESDLFRVECIEKVVTIINLCFEAPAGLVLHPTPRKWRRVTFKTFHFENQGSFTCPPHGHFIRTIQKAHFVGYTPTGIPYPSLTKTTCRSHGRYG